MNLKHKTLNLVVLCSLLAIACDVDDGNGSNPVVGSDTGTGVNQIQVPTEPIYS